MYVRTHTHLRTSRETRRGKKQTESIGKKKKEHTNRKQRQTTTSHSKNKINMDAAETTRRYEFPKGDPAMGDNWEAFRLEFVSNEKASAPVAKKLIHVKEFYLTNVRSAMLFADSIRSGALEEGALEEDYDEESLNTRDKQRIIRLYQASGDLVENLTSLNALVDDGQGISVHEDGENCFFDISSFLGIFLGLSAFAGYPNEYSEVVYDPDFDW